MRRLLVVSSALLLSACPFFDRGTEAVAPHKLNSLKVEALGVYVGSPRTPLAVVSECERQYGSQAQVPNEARGTPECRYVIPAGEVQIDLKATALDGAGQPMTDFNGPVSFRIIPGDLSNDQRGRWGDMVNGEITATIIAIHPYGSVRVWVEDAPPRLINVAGMAPDPTLLPVEPLTPEGFSARTFAAGASQIVYFADQTLASLQNPGVLDNRSSPFVGEFVVVGKGPNTGEKLRQSCLDDPARNGADALMVITGLDPAGFFVTDISACRVKEYTSDALGNTVRANNWEPPEPCWIVGEDGGRTENTDGGAGVCNISEKACRSRAECPAYLPGTFGSMFVYNYNFPDGLDEGDLLFTLSGSVQEFTSTSQLVFPAWLTAERVRMLPPEQWNKWLQYARPYDLGGRTCGADNVLTPFITDALCGHNTRNVKMESLESALVRARRVRFPARFVNCDFNGNGSVPFFCNDSTGGQHWDDCDFSGAIEPEADRLERTCNQDCVIGMGPHDGVICSEQSTFRGFGQYIVEMAPAGPASLGYDSQLPARLVTVTTRVYVPPVVPDAGVADAGMPDAGVDGGVELDAGVLDAGTPPNPSVRAGVIGGAQVVIRCEKDTRYRIGDDLVRANEMDPVLPANTELRYTMRGEESAVAFQAVSEVGVCTVGLNTRTRINLITKDAVPELNPDCNENDANTDAAEQCRFLRGAEFDVTGHLRQIQPGRPRWVIIPRAPDDLCCYPGPGMQCPRPIQACN
ncbi:MAG: hypothetical protein ACO1OB_05010 [Archangium sp.]